MLKSCFTESPQKVEKVGNVKPQVRRTVFNLGKDQASGVSVKNTTKMCRNQQYIPCFDS